MKKSLHTLLAAILALSVSFTSCKKTENTTDNNTDLATHADDEARFSSETDAVANDANTAIESYAAFSGRPGDVNAICNATSAMDSSGGNRTITITYNGANCFGNHTRTGVVVLSMPLTQHFRDQGAVLTVNVQNLKITRLTDNKSITINGVTAITNVTGGRIMDLATSSPIEHNIASSGMTVTFDNGTQRTWQIAKKRIFTYNNGMVITTTGMHTDGNISGISEWGTNRFGNAFVTSITAPMVIRQDCNFRLVQGQVTHQRLVANVVTTFGLDSAGIPTGCPNGSYYFKTVWTGINGIIRTVILPY